MSPDFLSVPLIFIVRNSPFSVDTRQRKNEIEDFPVAYSGSKKFRLGRWKIQVRPLKSSDLFVSYILTWEFQKRHLKFLNAL